MTFREAESFLSATEIDNFQPSVWADLGCGSGLFTKILSARLCDGSIIYAIDKSGQLPDVSVNQKVKVIGQQADFSKDDLQLQALNGVLIANAIHYVKDKKALLQKLKPYLLSTAVFIIIEYETNNANQWVPFPIPFVDLKDLFLTEGYKNIQKTGERKSVYQAGYMYASLIKPD